MKVIIIGVPKKISSGVRTHTQSLINGLMELGVSTEQISSYPSGFSKLIISMPVKIISLFNMDLAYRWKFFTRNLYMKYKIDKYIKKDNNENLVLNIQSVDWFYSIQKYISKKNVKVALTVHGAYSDQLKAKGYNNKIIKNIQSLESQAYSTIPRVITVSKHMKEYVERLSGRDDIALIPNGVTINDTEKLKKKDKSSMQLKCVFLGSLLYYKGVHIALDAIRRVKLKGIDISFDIIGDGPELKNLMKLSKDYNLEDNVRFLGLLPHSQVKKELLNYHISLIPSIPYGDTGEEAFPYACLESMSVGLITIASNIGGLSIMIENAYNGYLVKHGDSNEIANVIIENIDEILHSDTIGKNAISTVKMLYSSNAMAKKYLEVYNDNNYN